MAVPMPLFLDKWTAMITLHKEKRKSLKEIPNYKNYGIMLPIILPNSHPTKFMNLTFYFRERSLYLVFYGERHEVGRAQAPSAFNSIDFYRQILPRYHESIIYSIFCLSKCFVPWNSIHWFVLPKGIAKSGNPDQETFPNLPNSRFIISLI